LRKKIFCTEPTRAAKAEQKSLVSARQAQQTNKEGPLSLVLFESPFASVSTVSRGHPSLASLGETIEDIGFVKCKVKKNKQLLMMILAYRSACSCCMLQVFGVKILCHKRKKSP
jgi:hypothetical protein